MPFGFLSCFTLGFRCGLTFGFLSGLAFGFLSRPLFGLLRRFAFGFLSRPLFGLLLGFLSGPLFGLLRRFAFGFFGRLTSSFFSGLALGLFDRLAFGFFSRLTAGFFLFLATDLGLTPLLSFPLRLRQPGLPFCRFALPAPFFSRLLGQFLPGRQFIHHFSRNRFGHRRLGIQCSGHLQIHQQKTDDHRMNDDSHYCRYDILTPRLLLGLHRLMLPADRLVWRGGGQADFAGSGLVQHRHRLDHPVIHQFPVSANQHRRLQFAG